MELFSGSSSDVLKRSEVENGSYAQIACCRGLEIRYDHRWAESIVRTSFCSTDQHKRSRGNRFPGSARLPMIAEEPLSTHIWISLK